MGRTAPTKQIEKYKNSRRKAKRTMNRQRNSWISVKRLYLLLHWPWLCASNWGSSCVREGLNCGSLETELHRTLHHTGPLVEDACISLHAHMWQGSVSSSFSSSLFLVGLYPQDTCRIWITPYVLFPFSSCLSGLTPILAFLSGICMFPPYLCGVFFPGTLVQLVLMDLCVLC